MHTSQLTQTELRTLELKYDGRIPAQAIADVIAARPALTELQVAAYRRADRAALSKREMEVSTALDHAERLAGEIEELEGDLAAGPTNVQRVTLNINLNTLRTRHRLCVDGIARDLKHVAAERARLGMAPHTLTAVLQATG